MFTTLHELAKKATLMITVAAEGDGQLRVNVTPMPFDTKAKSNLPQPLSLLATPVEFDADFVAALSTWQAPKRTLIQQAQDSAGDDAPAAGAPALPAPKAEAKSDSKAEKSRKARVGKGGGDDDKKGDPVAAAAAPAGETAALADQVMDATDQPGAVELQAAGSGDASAATGAEAAPDQASHQAIGAASDTSAGEVQDGAPAGGAVADAAGEPAADAAAGDEPVDKFTLDLF